jgi:hypothetical protein
MARISIKEKKLYRSMRDHGVSKNKANRILKDVAGKRKARGRRRSKPVAAVKGQVKKLRRGRHEKVN